MKLKDCTKQELIQIIEQTFGEDDIQDSLDEVTKQRRRALKTLMEVYAELADKTMAEYHQLMAPYEGKAPTEIPIEVLQKGHGLLRKAHEVGAALDRLASSTRYTS